MFYVILLACTLMLALGTSASPLAETEEKYIRELEENIARIPALLNEIEEAPKINIEPFSKLSEALANLNIESIKGAFGYTEYDGINNITDFAKYTWMQYDYITEYLRSVNRNAKNNIKAIVDAIKNNVLTKITGRVLQNNYLYFNNYFNGTFKIHTNIPVCTMHRSRQQVIHDFYKIVVLADLMGTVVREIFVAIGEIPKVSDTNKNHTEFQKFLFRQRISYDNVKDAMNEASRSLYACDPAETARDEAFASLGLFQSALYFAKNPYSNQEDEAFTPCWKYSLQNNRCSSESWSVVSVSAGIRKFCDAPKFKLPFDTSLPLTSEYQSFSSSDVVPRLCEDETRGDHICISDVQLCITNSKKTDRYFHLGEVCSDSEENKVVTGVRLRKEGNFFYIQIQQGKLGPRDSIDHDTIEWKRIENKITDIDSYVQTHPTYKFPEANDDFHIIHNKLKSRYVNLDDINPPKNSKKRHALIGLKFVEEDGILKLEAETKPYDYETGKLHGRNEWRGNNILFQSRKELVLENPIEPIYYKRQYEISTPGTFVQFQGTTMKKSIEEISTVPFIDLQDVITKPSSPVSGAGIFVRGIKGSGGYLSLKLITQDYSPNF